MLRLRSRRSEIHQEGKGLAHLTENHWSDVSRATDDARGRDRAQMLALSR
ncbi:hypothetical protein CZ771_05820 [Actinomycetales bacterium JB111]|nr:hypothetical protein CZ771_05820 [Actinomycetales bacterium JB111]